MATTTNPDTPVLADATDAERAVVEKLRADFYDFPAATPDPEYVVRSRALLVALGTMYAAPNVVPGEDDGLFIDPDLCAGTWLNAIADGLYRLPADVDDVPLYGFQGGAQ